MTVADAHADLVGPASCGSVYYTASVLAGDRYDACPTDRYNASQNLCRNGIALMRIIGESVRATGTRQRGSGRHRRPCRCET